MKLSNLLLAALASLAMTMPLPSQAAYPDKPLTLVVPFGPGANADIISRRFADRLSRILGQPIVIDNRAGANGTIGLDRVAKAAPDGYTLGISSSSNTVAGPYLMKKMPFDYKKDFIPISGLYQVCNVLIVSSASKYQTYAQLIEQARTSPGNVSYGYAQSTAQIMGASWGKAANAVFTGVPYKSTPQAITDLLGGQVTAVFAEMSVALPQIAAGRVRTLAVVQPQRARLLPDVPTYQEVQPNGITIVGFGGFVVPARTPKEVTDRLASASKTILNDPEFVQFLSSLGADPLLYTSPQEFGDYMEKNEPVWRKGIEDAGIKAE